MERVLACIDGSVYAHSVADHAAWAAARYGAGVDLLQVIGRRDAASQDRSGRIVAGARKQLLDDLAALDAERARLLHKQGWLDLEEARARIEGAGVADVKPTLRHGDLLETLAEFEAAARLMVIGKRGEAADFATLHLGSNLERILRACTRPVLIAARAMRPIRRFMVAFDNRPAALRAVEAIARSPLFADIPGVVLTAGAPDAKTRAAQQTACERLREGGVDATARSEDGAPIDVIPRIVEDEGVDILVMGAYGHSRLRTLVIGSTTSEMIRACKTPIIVTR
jgi:nucleotide-binding universal stress UspA family protein